MSDDIREKIWNIQIVIDELVDFPQTYESILQDLKNDGTCQMILRRKLNTAVKDGLICKTTIPGTRYGKVIFYVIEKKYHIVVESTRFGSDVFCFADFKKLNNFVIEVQKIWKLNGDEWKKMYGKKFVEGNILKWI